MTVSSWQKADAELVDGRDIHVAIVDGGRAIAHVELVDGGAIVLVDRQDRYRRTIERVADLATGKARVEHLLAR